MNGTDVVGPVQEGRQRIRPVENVKHSNSIPANGATFAWEEIDIELLLAVWHVNLGLRFHGLIPGLLGCSSQSSMKAAMTDSSDLQREPALQLSHGHDCRLGRFIVPASRDG
jgi:hypothetical protein